MFILQKKKKILKGKGRRTKCERWVARKKCGPWFLATWHVHSQNVCTAGVAGANEQWIPGEDGGPALRGMQILPDGWPLQNSPAARLLLLSILDSGFLLRSTCQTARQFSLSHGPRVLMSRSTTDVLMTASCQLHLKKCLYNNTVQDYIDVSIYIL